MTKIKIRAGYPVRQLTSSAGPLFEVRMQTTPDGAPDRRQVRRRFRDLDAAYAFVDQVRSQVREGSFQHRDQTTLRQLADAWMQSKDDVRDISRSTYENVLKPVLRDHGDRRVQSITRQEIERWKATWPTTGGSRGRGLSRRSIEITLRALSLAFQYGIEHKIIRDNPAAGVRLPRETLADQRRAAARKVNAQTWSFEQLRRFVEAADADEYAALWRLTTCGLRRSEILGLEWSAVDFDAGTVEIRQGRVRGLTDKVKSERSARVVNAEEMVPGTVAALRQLRAQQAAQRLAIGAWPTDLVAVDGFGQPLDPDVYARRFARIAHEAGLPKIKLHAVRHTIATELHDRGVAPATAAALLGHSVETHLAVYVRSTEQHQAAAAAAFGLAFAANRK